MAYKWNWWDLNHALAWREMKNAGCTKFAILGPLAKHVASKHLI